MRAVLQTSWWSTRSSSVRVEDVHIGRCSRRIKLLILVIYWVSSEKAVIIHNAMRNKSCHWNPPWCVLLSVESCSLISILHFGDEVRTNFLKHQQCKVLGQLCVCIVEYRMTSTGLFGCVGEFIAQHERFNAYVERMEMFLTANNIVETTGEGSTPANRVIAARKRAIFLTEVGAEVYSTLSNLLVPTKLKDTSFVTLCVYWRSITIQNCWKLRSFHFGTWNQKWGGSVGITC